MGSGEGLLVMFVIVVLAAVLVATLNVLAEPYPQVALCVAVFCMVLLAVMIVLLLARRDSEE